MSVEPINVFARENYRAILQDELAVRQKKNLSYSQRAFARDIGIGPNRLSEILNGKQGLSPAYAKLISKNLGYSQIESAYFCEMVRKIHSRSRRERDAAALRLKALRKDHEYQPLKLDVFRVISEWHHLAIIEMSKLHNFRPRSTWIAKRLGLKETVVKESLALLEKVGLLIRQDGEFQFQDLNCMIPESVPSESIKRFHEGVLEKASKAIRTQGLEKREYSTTLMAIDSKLIPEIKKRVNLFWREMDAEFGGRGTPDQIYSLGVQLFSVTENE